MQVVLPFLLLLFLPLQIYLDLHFLVLLCPLCLFFQYFFKVMVVELVEGFLDQRAEVEEGHLPACQFQRFADAPEHNSWALMILAILLTDKLLSFLDKQDHFFQLYGYGLYLLQPLILQHQFFAELRQEPRHYFSIVPFYGVSLPQCCIYILHIRQLHHLEVLPRIFQLQIPGLAFRLSQFLLPVSLLLRLTPLQMFCIVLDKSLEVHHLIADLLLYLLLILCQIILKKFLTSILRLAALLHKIQLLQKGGKCHKLLLYPPLKSPPKSPTPILLLIATYRYRLALMNSKKQNNNKSTPRVPCMIDCHFCIEPFEKSDVSLARCCMKRCNKNYCISCIKAHFNPEFDMQMYRKDTWICYLCQGICVCDRCKKGEGSDRKMMRKKSARSKAMGEEEVELSGSNLSQNNMRAQPINQSQQQDDLLLDFNEQEQESDQYIPEFKLYSQEEMVQFPPFYRKIAERRNKFYSFILKTCRKRRPIAKKREPRTERKDMEADKND